ncbi:hypothetical protein [Streptomyces sp. NPDC002250]|uniref:ATP-dependent DNA ligase n=1 Tax=Streptomyces sp. NPDC002250 TaxID=3364641 RepID=UPI00369A63A7
MRRRGARAARAAAEWPAHFVAFDLLRLSGTDTTGWPYRRRRAALESVFAARRLSAPWVLCPSTTDPDTVREWLTWASVGMEGVLFKRLDATLVEPELVVEVGVDVARDASGRWRHPARWHRPRPDLSPG